MFYLKSLSAYQREMDKYDEAVNDVLNRHEKQNISAEETLRILKREARVYQLTRELRQGSAEALWKRLSMSHRARIILRALIGRCSNNEHRLLAAMSKEKLPDVIMTIWKKPLAVRIKIFVMRLVTNHHVRREAIRRAVAI